MYAAYGSNDEDEAALAAADAAAEAASAACAFSAARAAGEPGAGSNARGAEYDERDGAVSAEDAGCEWFFTEELYSGKHRRTSPQSLLAISGGGALYY